METRAAAAQRVYEDFVPSHELIREEGANTLVVDLPEFNKEQIRVQLDNFGNLRISGERPLADNRWSRFRKNFKIPEDSNASEIRARFEKGRLYVKLARLITEASVKDQPTQVQEPKENQKPIGEPKPSTAEPYDVPKKQQDEKRRGPTYMKQDAKKVRKKVKDQTEEKKGKEKFTSEEGEKGGAKTDVPKKKHAAPSSGQNRLGKWKLKVGELGLGFYKPRQPMVTVTVAVVVLVGVGLYVIYKLRSPMVEDGH
ncbi:inactive protein RESTRICTED TEV MOVEMENT 2-like [Phoenix dactylifera]|uniref:Inactive protein RESTRICTED TEV MOVEMENT 2-like n=1 Tax=Phoenix dactylifera TaxID=42345 RepID=A0A8B7MTR5_PHODC|nr:inactive protein RESTRICTED TEV MOVEMENT 2-like [Phoenix dactylifera]